jgi:hypothetical protein
MDCRSLAAANRRMGASSETILGARSTILNPSERDVSDRDKTRDVSHGGSLYVKRNS